MELWTRVIKLFGDNRQAPGTHSISEDLRNEQDHWQEQDTDVEDSVICHFDPTPYKPRSVEMALEDHRLSQSQLMEYANRVTAIRKAIVTKGLAMNELIQKNAQYLPESHRLRLFRLHRNYTIKLRGLKAVNDNLEKAREFPNCKYRKRKYSALSISEIVDIVYEVKVKYSTHDFVAKLFHVGVATVAHIISKIRKNAEFLRELLSKKQTIQDARSAIREQTE